MAMTVYDFEAGTVGSTVDTATSGFSGISLGAGASFVYSAAHPVKGSKGVAITSPNVQTHGRSAIGLGSSQIEVHAYFYLETIPTVDVYPVRAYQGDGATKAWSWRFVNNGKLRVEDASGSAGIWTSTNTIAAGSTVQLSIWTKPGTTTSNGQVKIAYYLNGSSTPAETPVTITTANLGTTGIDRVYFGKWDSSSYAGTLYMDYCA